MLGLAIGTKRLPFNIRVRALRTDRRRRRAIQAEGTRRAYIAVSPTAVVPSFALFLRITLSFGEAAGCIHSVVTRYEGYGQHTSRQAIAAFWALNLNRGRGAVESGWAIDRLRRLERTVGSI